MNPPHKNMAQYADLISAVEIVRKYGISYQTLNYYTNLGLIKNAQRKGRTRFYDEEGTVRRLEKIKELQNKGYTLKLIAEIINSQRNALDI